MVLTSSRCAFIGKTSPLNFFWGSFDLALTRFSGRPAPPREGPAFMRDAYSHEVISHGFWPGGGTVLEPVFYAYSAPEPAGFKEARVEPDAAFYHAELGSSSCRMTRFADRHRRAGAPGIHQQHLYVPGATLAGVGSQGTRAASRNMTLSSTAAVHTLADAYRRNRARSRALFDLLSAEAYWPSHRPPSSGRFL